MGKRQGIKMHEIVNKQFISQNVDTHHFFWLGENITFDNLELNWAKILTY
jgi:hypothetical protein